MNEKIKQHLKEKYNCDVYSIKDSKNKQMLIAKSYKINVRGYNMQELVYGIICAECEKVY